MRTEGRTTAQSNEKELKQLLSIPLTTQREEALPSWKALFYT